MAASKKQIIVLKKKLEEVEKAKAQAEKAKEEAKKAREEAEQHGYDVGVAETVDAFRAEVPEVCRTYCFQVWNEALNQAGVEASSILRKVENIYYPPAIRASSSSNSKVYVPAKVADLEKNSSEKVLSSSGSPSEVAEQTGVNEKEAPRMEIVLASLPLPAKGDPKGTDQGSSKAAAQQSKAPPQGKIVIKRSRF